MTFSNISSVTLTFDISHVNDRSMSIEFNNNGVIDFFDQLPEGIFTYKTAINFPSKFFITVGGKDSNDTLVDSNGTITKDKYIQLLDIEVDNISCSPHYVFQRLSLNTVSGETITTNYWGFNGSIELNFHETNSFFWALHSIDV